VQLFLAVGLPIVANAAMLILFQQSVNRQLDAFNQDIHELRSDLKLRTGKVYGMMEHGK
jgi:hypothetical protein